MSDPHAILLVLEDGDPLGLLVPGAHAAHRVGRLMYTFEEAPHLDYTAAAHWRRVLVAGPPLPDTPHNPYHTAGLIPVTWTCSIGLTDMGALEPDALALVLAWGGKVVPVGFFYAQQATTRATPPLLEDLGIAWAVQMARLYQREGAGRVVLLDADGQEMPVGVEEDVIRATDVADQECPKRLRDALDERTRERDDARARLASSARTNEGIGVPEAFRHELEGEAWTLCKHCRGSLDGRACTGRLFAAIEEARERAIQGQAAKAPEVDAGWQRFEGGGMPVFVEGHPPGEVPERWILWCGRPGDKNTSSWRGPCIADLSTVGATVLWQGARVPAVPTEGEVRGG